ncbi:outer membrane beta-barrel protein [Flavobacterium sp.]|uniref:outer membrane beta-barrel protein n=1 Tax=Flavobacterium sp. TaxID=239 RepID=UPI00286E0B47|nr:outer membrane beta-barrel protein [Flavobacterium sp.]
MKKVTLILGLMLTSITFAQETTPASTPLEISGSADGYFKYDFSKNENIPTSFATDHGSFSLGMLDLILKKTSGKFSFVGDVAFGPRGQYQSVPNGDGTALNADNSFNIQNLYGTYTFSDKLSVTAGYAGTFIGYEVISPVANFHYSTSYLFTNGPFQHAGVKANYKVSDKFGAMVGIFNDQWNVYKNPTGAAALGGQLSYAVDGVSAYLNFMDGKSSGTIVDLTAAFQITKEFKLGVNGADFKHGSSPNVQYDYTGFALYPSYAISDAFALGLRGEYFSYKTAATDWDVTAITLSGNYKLGSLTLIPEFRFDNNSEEVFMDVDMMGTKSAAQFLVAGVYSF